MLGGVVYKCAKNLFLLFPEDVTGFQIERVEGWFTFELQAPPSQDSGAFVGQFIDAENTIFRYRDIVVAKIELRLSVPQFFAGFSVKYRQGPGARRKPGRRDGARYGGRNGGRYGADFPSFSDFPTSTGALVAIKKSPSTLR